MKLLSLTLNNFRQFAGENTVEFGDSNKVTVIYGLNGYGKTGIFRAIIFCLYGNTYLERDNLDTAQRNKGLVLVNQNLVEKAKGNYVEASVKLKFEHNKVIYELSRSILCAKQGEEFNQEYGDVKLVQTVNNSTKAPITDHDQIKQILDSIIDQKNKDFFLFDGEQMEELTQPSTKSMKDIKRGITDLLRLDAINVVRNEFSKAEKSVEREIRDNSLSAELDKVNEDIEKNEKAIDALETGLKTIENELALLDKEKAEIADKLRASAEGAEKQKEKDKLEKEISNIDDDLGEIRRQMKETLKTLPAYLGESVVNDALNDLKQRADRGELPSNIKDDFIQELLTRGRCICGNDLKVHTEAADILKDYLNKSIGKYAEAGFQVYQMTKDLTQKISLRINRDTEEILQKYSSKKNEKEGLNKKVQGINGELKASVSTKDYATRNANIDADIKRNLEKKGASESELTAQRIKHEELYKKRAEYSKQDEKLAEFQRQLDLLRKSSSALEDVYNAYSDELRVKLSACATEIMKQIADKETLQAISRIEISDKFILDVLSPSNINILPQISSGQRQVVSIAYICSLMQVAIGLEMPLLMDTPFGRLSGAPRDACLQRLPNLLTQWILLTTDTEFTIDEANALKKSGAWHKIYEIESSGGVSKLVEKDINHWKPIRSTI